MKLFNLGLPKSGTSSLNLALEILGYKSCHWTIGPKNRKKARKYVGDLIYQNLFSRKDIFEGFDCDAITQSDVCLPAKGLNFWPQLDPLIRRILREKHATCKFVLLKRNPRAIVESIRKWNNMFFRIVVSEIPGLPAWRGESDEDLVFWIESHFAAVEEEFGGLPNYYSFYIDDPGSFENFCDFLGCEKKIEAWPRENVASPDKGHVQYQASTYWLARDVSRLSQENTQLSRKLASCLAKLYDATLLDKNSEINWSQKRSSQIEGLRQKKINEEISARLSGLEAELEFLKGERDVLVTEKAAAAKSAEELKQQLMAQTAQVQDVQKARDDQAARVKALEAEKAAAAKSAEELKQQLTAQSAQVQEVQKARDDQAARMKALEAEKAAAAKSAEELKQQLMAQSAQVQEVQKARDEQAARAKALEAELAQQTGNLAAMAQALQHLRQLAAPSTP